MNEKSNFTQNTRNSNFIKKIQANKKWICDRCGNSIPDKENSIFMLRLNKKLDADKPDNYQLFCVECSEKIIQEDKLKPIKN